MDNTGLAFEAAKILTRADGAFAKTRQIGDVKITDVRLSAEAGARIGKRAGRYITLHGEPHAAGMTALLRRALLQLLPPRGRLFAAGLGNPDVTPDRLGAAAIRSVIATGDACRQKNARYSFAAVETDVAARTGIETARLVKAITRELKPDCVIIVDALSCKDPRFIGKTVQLSSAGITPGSGSADRGDFTAVTPELLHCPVASIGVPTVAALSAVTNDPKDNGFLVTPPDIDTIINMWAEVIGGALSN
ncbi:MAG: GPR endopeptidase [Oscillospiraceae bacterium]|nr:GPR endopeptidase [Oscillospiraceae bacterium]